MATSNRITFHKSIEEMNEHDKDMKPISLPYKKGTLEYALKKAGEKSRAAKPDGRINNGGHDKSGRKKLYTEEMKAVTIRVPAQEHSAIKELEKEIRKKYLRCT